MGLHCVVSYPIPETPSIASTTFISHWIQPWAVGNGRHFQLEDKYLKSVKELFGIIKKTRGVKVRTYDANAMAFFSAAARSKAETSLRIDLIRTFDKGDAPPVMMVLDTTSRGTTSLGGNIARLDLRQARVSNFWHGSMGGGDAAFDAKQVVLHWVDQSEPAAAR